MLLLILLDFTSCSGSSALKIPEPTKTPSQPKFITNAASAGVDIPPAAKFTTGNLDSLAVSLIKE